MKSYECPKTLSKARTETGATVQAPGRNVGSSASAKGGRAKLGLAESLLVKLVKALLDGDQGTLNLTLPSGLHLQVGGNAPFADIRLHSLRPLWRLVTGGTNGWSEAYLEGEWDSSDLPTLVRWALRYEPALERLSPAQFINGQRHNRYHRSRDNHRHGSRRNIAEHYDLGNDFYRRWLDDSMTYSAALFQDSQGQQTQDLAQAQRNKYARILELLDAQPGQHVAEIGCGWGGFAEQAAAEEGLQVDGITLSQEQLQYARERIERQGLSKQARFSLTDYRDFDGQYDGIVSIEMFEAVGENHWDSYFQMLKARLKPGGRAVLQIITIDDRRFHSYRKQADFIQRYIFPGGMLPSTEVLQQLFRQHGFKLDVQQMFGLDYARTLQYWSEAFEQHWPDIQHMNPGFDDRFYRLWRYYLAYCEGGFNERAIDVGLFVLSHDQGAE